MKLTRSRIIAAIAFLCLLAGSLEIYDPVVPKDAGTVLRAIEDKTQLPVTGWAEAVTGKSYAKAKQPRNLVDVAMDKMVEQQEVEAAAKALITLKHIQFEGVTILGDIELKGIVEPFLNTPMTYEQMLEIGMVVEQYYRKNNYLARAVLPPQDLTDGLLTVDVIESVFSKVEIEQELADLPNTQAHVEAIIEAQQKTGEPLNSKSLDRALALANNLPGMSAQGSLRQGREAGETELLLKLYQGRTRQTELTMDNGGSRSTGAMRLMANMTWFNPNDLADLLSVVAVHTQGSDYARLAYSMPVGTDGWRMGANASVMDYKVIVGQQGMVGAVGRAVTQGLEWVYPLLRADDHSATVTLTADTKKFENTSAQGLLMSDYKAKVMAAQVAELLPRPQSYKDNILYREKKNIHANFQSVSETLQRVQAKLPANEPSTQVDEALAALDATGVLSDGIHLDDAQILLNGELGAFDENELRAKVKQMQEKLTRVNQTLKDIENKKEST